MRDILITLLVFSTLPFIVMRPSNGVYVWSWLGYMNPHRLAYGFAYSFPFAAVVAAATMLGFIFSKEKKMMHWTPTTALLIIWVLWMCITTALAIFPDAAWDELKRTLKIQFMVLLTLMLINDRNRIDMLVWVIALSIGFYGIKGGVFAVLKGFNYRILGPEGSFIWGNNEIAFALIMTIPLFRYLQIHAKNAYIRWGLGIAMVLMGFSVISSYSRGAFVAGSLMLMFFIWFSKKKFMLIAALLIITPIVISVLPAKWFDRMNTIESYEEDNSALGRINAWYFAFNLSKDHPIKGGGYGTFNPDLFYIYAPEPENFHDSHSIYFEVLAEQGYVGLVIFLGLGILTFLNIRWIVKHTRDRPELEWCRNLALMIFVALIGYITGGLFIGLAYFDLPYHYIALVVIVRQFVARSINPVETLSSSQPKPPATRRFASSVNPR